MEIDKNAKNYFQKDYIISGMIYIENEGYHSRARKYNPWQKCKTSRRLRNKKSNTSLDL
jgi:hypothetical protein